MTRARDVANVLATATALATDAETAALIATEVSNRDAAIAALPARGNTSNRPASPAIGDIYNNTQTGNLETYTSLGWSQIGVIPNAPTSLVATNVGTSRAYNNGSASVAFSAGTGGLPTSYTVTSSPGSYTSTGSTSPLVVTGLQSSTQYTYTATATNNYGTSSASSASSGVTATTVPQAPTVGTVTSGNAEASVPFTAGATGGSSITSYTVTSSPGSITASGSSSPITITGLTNETSYTFTVTATNANGTSEASSASSSVTPQAWVPIGAYDSIATATISNGTTTTITFSSIPSTYTHLQLRYIIRTDRGDDYGDAIGMRFNFDNGSNYYRHRFETENTGGVVAGGSLGTDAQYHFMGASALSSSNVFASGVVDILDYANTSKNKTTKSLSGYLNSASQNWMGFESSVWLSTSAVNRIDLKINYGTNYAVGSTVALYGIKGA